MCFLGSTNRWDTRDVDVHEARSIIFNRALEVRYSTLACRYLTIRVMASTDLVKSRSGTLNRARARWSPAKVNNRKLALTALGPSKIPNRIKFCLSVDTHEPPSGMVGGCDTLGSTSYRKELPCSEPSSSCALRQR